MNKSLNIPIVDRTVPQLFSDAVQRAPNKVFVRGEGKAFTYADFDRLTNACAHNFSDLGLEKGTKLGIFMHNSLAFIHSWLAAAKLGVIYVPINTDYKGDILQYQLNKADVTHLVVD